MEQLLQNMNALSKSPSLVPRPPPPGGKQPKARELTKLTAENRRGRPHFCDVCGKNFTSQHGLNMHRLIHTSDKPHRCEICGKCFIQQVSCHGNMSRVVRKPVVGVSEQVQHKLGYQSQKIARGLKFWI